MELKKMKKLKDDLTDRMIKLKDEKENYLKNNLNNNKTFYLSNSKLKNSKSSSTKLLRNLLNSYKRGASLKDLYIETEKRIEKEKLREKSFRDKRQMENKDKKDNEDKVSIKKSPVEIEFFSI